MSDKVAHPRASKARAAGVCLIAASVALLPSMANAADTASPVGSTVRAALNSDGAVTSVTQYKADGSSGTFTGQLPVTLKITHTGSDTAQTWAYHVENTLSQTQTLHYDDTAGNPHHTSTLIQLPLVAQLGVDVPKSVTNLSAPGATVTSDANGTRHLLWSMVLFSPLGASAQDVTFTGNGSGSPVVELRAVTADPNTTPGLSGVSQNATAGYQQDDFWSGYANGANDGLTKLSSGTGQLVDGLVQAFAGATQLHNGIVTAGAGAVQLDDGTKQAYDGSQQLTSGIGKIHGGIHQLASPSKGLPAALSGVKQIQKGVQAILAGVGDDTTSGTLINGQDQLISGLNLLVSGFTDPTQGVAVGLNCASDVLDVVVNGNATAKPDPCWAQAPFNGTKPVLPALKTVPGAATYAAIVNGVLTQAIAPIASAMNTTIVPAMTALAAGAKQIRAGMSHKPGTSGNNDKGGIKEGLQAVNGGLQQLKSGLKLAVGGVNQLDAGSKKAFGGSQSLTDGLRQLSAGQHQVATGLPAAVTGTAQLATGLGQAVDGGRQINAGIDQVQTDAVQPLATQLDQSSLNNHKQLAVLQAAANMASQAPGGEGTSYVLSQSADGVTLAAGPAAVSSLGGVTAGRAATLYLSAVGLLVLGLGAGFMVGRNRRRLTADE